MVPSFIIRKFLKAKSIPPFKVFILNDSSYKSIFQLFVLKSEGWFLIRTDHTITVFNLQCSYQRACPGMKCQLLHLHIVPCACFQIRDIFNSHFVRIFLSYLPLFFFFLAMVGSRLLLLKGGLIETKNILKINWTHTNTMQHTTNKWGQTTLVWETYSSLRIVSLTWTTGEGEHINSCIVVKFNFSYFWNIKRWIGVLVFSSPCSIGLSWKFHFLNPDLDNLQCHFQLKN